MNGNWFISRGALEVLIDVHIVLLSFKNIHLSLRDSADTVTISYSVREREVYSLSLRANEAVLPSFVIFLAVNNAPLGQEP